MQFQHVKDGDWTCAIWFDELQKLTRPSFNGYSVTVARSDDGFKTIRCHLDEFDPETLAIHANISGAFDYVRPYLLTHKEDGFFLV